MYGKKLIRKIGSLVVIATLIASAFVVMQNGMAVNGGSVHDVGISTDYTGAVNGIKITRDGTDVVGANESLIIGETYKIRYKLSNYGDYNESIHVTVMVGNTTIETHDYSLNSGQSNTYADEWNTTGLAPGDYTIIVNASIENDSNPSNNIAQRTVTLEEYTPPIILSLIYPTGGEIIGGIIPIKWNASSSLGKSLSIKIEYLNETGSAKLIADNLANTGIYYWNATGLEKGKNYKIRITATDEEGNVESTTSGFFTITQMDVTPYMAYYNETKTIDVAGCTGNVKLWYPKTANPTWPTDYGVKYERDGSAGNARFSNILLNVTGPWLIEDEGSNALYYLLVNPIKLNVTVSPSTFNFTKTTEGWVQLSGRVTHNEEPMKNVIVEIWAPGQKAGEGTPLASTTTTANGTYKLVDVGVLTNGAGKYNITARIGELSNPNAFGSTLFIVKSVEANITLNNNSAKGGFDIGKIEFQITDMEGNRILDNYYNISVYKGEKLYAWVNKSRKGTIQHGTIDFDIAGKHLNLTTTSMWETGDYTLKVKSDVVGSSDWEYYGSIDFSIPAPPKVNINVTPKTINVSDPAHNAQVIQVQIFGENMTTYGDEEHGFKMDNITERLKVGGDVLYTPPKDAYEYHGNGVWWVKVFPAYGNGTIYINVSWPGKGEARETVKVEKGGKATVEPKEVIVDAPDNITVTVEDNNGNPVASANVTLYYESGLYGLDGVVNGATMVGDGSQNKGLHGVYKFINITSKKADKNIIVVVNIGYNNLYAYAVIKSKAAHDLNATLTPANVLAGKKTEFKINVTKNGESYGNRTGLEFYLLNETQLEKFHNEKIDLSQVTNITNNVNYVSKGNYTFQYVITKADKYYIYVRTANKKHDIPAGSEPRFEVTKASVTASPSMLVKNVDKNMTITFTVTWNGKPLNGTLYLNNITWLTNSENNTVKITNGKGNITGINATAKGNITFEFKPEGTENKEAPADGMLPVVLPDVTIVEPKDGIVYLGVENVIILQVTHPLTHKGCKGLEITMGVGGGDVNAGKTDANGKLVFGIMPWETGNITIKVGEDLVKGKEIKIVVGLKINAPSKIEKGKEFTIVVTTMGGSPVKGATVKVDGSEIGTTDANGIIKYKAEKSGTITITASKEGYHGATLSIEVTKPPKEQPGFEFIGLIVGLLAAILIARRRK